MLAGIPCGLKDIYCTKGLKTTASSNLPFTSLSPLLTNESSIVIDPFCGVCSVGIAAGRLGRRFVGIEISKKYFKMAEKRLAE